MSHYVECRPGFQDWAALFDALVAVGFERQQIELHEQPVELFGYQGDVREQKAHVVIRRQHVGPAANDVGWERMPDGTYRAWISEYDGRHRFNSARQEGNCGSRCPPFQNAAGSRPLAAAFGHPKRASIAWNARNSLHETANPVELACIGIEIAAGGRQREVTQGMSDETFRSV